MIYDLIIIGLGPAGISAAIYAKRGGLKVLCLEANAPGGLLNSMSKLDNYPGFNQGTGPDLAYQMFDQINKLNIEYKIERVLNIKNDQIKEIETNKNKYQTKKVLIATGRKVKNLGIENEKKYEGKGLSYCAICDANLYKGKIVAVVGSGNSAVEESLYLASIVDKVYIINRSNQFKASNNLINELSQQKNVEIIYNSNVTKINGESVVENITINDDKIIEVSAIFTYIGYEPYIDFIKELNITDENSYILTDQNQETKIPGIYAAGDGIKKEVYQVVTATSEGAIAALHAINNRS